MSPMIWTSSAPADPTSRRKQVSEATPSPRMSIVMPCILSCVLPDWPSAFQILIPLRKWLPAIIFRLQAFELLVKCPLGNRCHGEPQRRPREMDHRVANLIGEVLAQIEGNALFLDGCLSTLALFSCGRPSPGMAPTAGLFTNNDRERIIIERVDIIGQRVSSRH